MPTEKLENGSWPHPARLPLGAGWSGYCTAPGHENGNPSKDILEAFCNLGYASSCPWAPQDRPWDAVRFGFVAQTDREKSAGANDGNCSRIVRLCYVCERGHLPVERGEMEFDLDHSAWVRPHTDPRLQKMAECFLNSHAKRSD